MTADELNARGRSLWDRGHPVVILHPSQEGMAVELQVPFLRYEGQYTEAAIEAKARSRLRSILTGLLVSHFDSIAKQQMGGYFRVWPDGRVSLELEDCDLADLASAIMGFMVPKSAEQIMTADEDVRKHNMPPQLPADGLDPDVPITWDDVEAAMRGPHGPRIRRGTA